MTGVLLLTINASNFGCIKIRRLPFIFLDLAILMPQSDNWQFWHFWYYTHSEGFGIRVLFEDLSRRVIKLKASIPTGLFFTTLDLLQFLAMKFHQEHQLLSMVQWIPSGSDVTPRWNTWSLLLWKLLTLCENWDFNIILWPIVLVRQQ